MSPAQLRARLDRLHADTQAAVNTCTSEEQLARLLVLRHYPPWINFVEQTRAVAFGDPARRWTPGRLVTALTRLAEISGDELTAARLLRVADERLAAEEKTDRLVETIRPWVDSRLPQLGDENPLQEGGELVQFAYRVRLAADAFRNLTSTPTYQPMFLHFLLGRDMETPAIRLRPGFSPAGDRVAVIEVSSAAHASRLAKGLTADDRLSFERMVEGWLGAPRRQDSLKFAARGGFLMLAPHIFAGAGRPLTDATLVHEWNKRAAYGADLAERNLEAALNRYGGPYSVLISKIDELLLTFFPYALR